MVKIFIEDKQYEVKSSKNLLETCLSLGYEIPYFCWHPKLGSVGSCRQCVVKQYNNNSNSIGNLVISCMTPVINNNYIYIYDSELKKFRSKILELLMINHPHDCPICEEGGNCHLQDMTVISKHISRRYKFKKKIYKNQYLGPFISHKMNRCIKCYRCIRYYKDYSGGNDLGVFGSSNNLYFGRFKEGKLKNEFSGNLIEICPTGVFTDKTQSKHYNRKWDIQFSPNICNQCSIGCNISIGERYNKFVKIDNRYNKNINNFFLCDRGRFGYEYLNRIDRPFLPKIKKKKKNIYINEKKIIKKIKKKLKKSKKIIGIGSSRASLESNFSLLNLVGKENFYTGINKKEQEQLSLILDILYNGGIHTPSLKEIENYDCIIILGEDLTQTAPRMALSIRQAINKKKKKKAKNYNIESWNISSIINLGQNIKNKLFITNVDKTNLDDISTWSYHANVKNQAKLAFEISNLLKFSKLNFNKFNDYLNIKINNIVKSLKNSKKPLIISGTNSGSKKIILSAYNIAKSLKILGKKKVGISFIASSANSIGLMMMRNNNINDALNKLIKKKIDTLIVLENDLYRNASYLLINKAILLVKNLIVIDYQKTFIQKKANFILSSTNFAESNGTLINNELRMQRFFKVYNPNDYYNRCIILESWRWLNLLKFNKFNDKNINNLNYLYKIIEKKCPQFIGIKKLTPKNNFTFNGKKISRKPNRYSGHTSMYSNIDIHEKSVLSDKETFFSFSKEGYIQNKSKNEYLPFVWFPGWNSSQSLNKFKENNYKEKINNNFGFKINQKKFFLINYFNNFYKKKKNKKKKWIIAPYWFLFGSEETSQLSIHIQKAMSKIYIIINKKDSKKLNYKKNCLISIFCKGIKFTFKIKISSKLNSGQIGIPLGLPGIPPYILGKKAYILKREKYDLS